MNIQQNIKKIGISLLALSYFIPVLAQQDPQYTQYMYNTNIINPAYAGSRESLSVFGLYRTQWVGLDGAPKTANVSVSTPLGLTGLGLGVNFTNDQLGAMTENNISLDLSYTVNLNPDYKLAFGLKGTANLLDIDYNKLNIHNPSDPVSQENIKNKFKPNVGAGVYMYSDKAYVGMSVPNFITKQRYDDNDFSTKSQKASFYLMGGYVFDLSRNLLFKPAALIKTVSGAPLQVDITANFLLYDKLTLGTSYRWDSSLSGLVGFQVNENLFIGYTYDSDTSRLNNYNSGSHEIFLRFELFNHRKLILAPRFF